MYKVTSASRIRAILTRNSKARRRAARKETKENEKNMTFNFTADLFDKLNLFENSDKKDNEIQPDPNVTETNENDHNEERDPNVTETKDNDKKEESAEITDLIAFPKSRTIIAAVAQKDFTLLEELLSDLPKDENQDAHMKGLSPRTELNHALMMAITDKHEALVQRLLDAGADVHYFDHIYPMMLLAVDNRATDVFKLLVKHCKSYDATSVSGNLVHAAVRSGDIDILKQVISFGLDINATSKISQATPLHEAVRCVKYIHKQKPPSLFSLKDGTTIKWNSEMPNVQSNNKKRRHEERDESDTKSATELKQTDKTSEFGYDLTCIDYLISKGIDVNAKDMNGKTALHEAAIMNNAVVAKCLTRAGADTNVADTKAHTPMMYAIEYSHSVELVDILCDENTLHERISEDGEYSMHLACKAGNAKVLRYLISRNCDVETMCNEMTPLMYAIDKGQLACAKILLKETDCDATFVNTNGHSALYYLQANDTQFESRREVLQLLISRKADINKSNTYGVTSLLEQVNKSHKQWAQCLLDNGADVNYISENGEYAILVAVSRRDNEMVQLLLGANANMNMTSHVCTKSSLIGRKNFDKTPLQIALNNSHDTMVQLLLAAGCSTSGATKWLNGDGKQIKDNFSQENKHLVAYIENTPSAPLRLQDLARHATRARIGSRDVTCKYESLPLPSLLRKYLNIETCMAESNEFLDSLREI